MTYRFTTKQTLLLVLGPQGSGKGTQVSLLKEKLAVPVVTMGEIFRQEMVKPTDRGRQVKEILGPGGLVPAEIWEPVLRDYLADCDLSQGAILDGVVRSMEQVTAFDRIRDELGLSVPFVVNIQVPEEESVKRLLLRGRHDDTESGIRQRLTWSRNETEPVIDHYRSLNRVTDINGNQSIDAVQMELVTKLTDAAVIQVTE